MHLDHTIIPTHDASMAAAFYSDILGLKHLGEHGHFEAVQVDNNLTLLFSNKAEFSRLHFAFKVREQDYTEILMRVKRDPKLDYGDSPSERSNSREYHHEFEIGFYFDDLDKHILEVFTSRVSAA